MTDLTTRLTLYRARHDLNKKQLGAMIGVTGSTICKWESGRNKPSCANLRRIESLLEDDKINGDTLIWRDDLDGQIGMTIPAPDDTEEPDDGDPRIWGVVFFTTLILVILLGATIWKLA